MGVPFMGGLQRTSDLESFTWFFAAEYPHVVRLLSVVLHDPAAAEDVAQDAFVRLHRHWDQVSRYDAPEAWVRRVALNCAFSLRRREARRREREASAEELRPPDPASPGTDRADVIRAVRKLPPRDRALIGLYHLEDRPVAEVADLLGMRVGAAKVALHRARRRLADLLADSEVAR
jgi:RNA polymerase sigma-70 factor (ECF subfamily)